MIMTSPITSPVYRRAVSFSPRSEAVVIPEVGKRPNGWYTKEDTNRFKRNLLTESRRMSRLVASTPLGMISQDTSDELVGIESFLSLDMLMIIQTRKRQHVQGIVSMQSVCSKEDLLFLSKESSSWSRDGAINRAAGMKT